MRIRIAAAAAALLACAWATPAQAHVTIHPNVLPASGFTVVNVRVPNERDSARTTKVDVQLPSGLLFVSHQPIAGWSARVTYRKLAQPVERHGEQIRQEAARVTWTATGRGIGRGEFVELPLSISVPDAAGSQLTFKALQGYSNGEVVRWIGAADTDAPAPRVAVIGESGDVADRPSGVEGIDAMAGDPVDEADDADDADDDGPSLALVLVALALGAGGFVAGLAGLVAARRARTMG